MTRDPEDLYLMHSMFKLIGYNVRDADSGVYELQTTMLERNAAHFWKCFLRVLRCLHVAQYKLGSSAQVGCLPFLSLLPGWLFTLPFSILPG